MGLTWGKLGSRLYKSAKSKRVPISGQFELTARCNLQCKMCYICRPATDRNSIQRERTAEEWIRLAKEARDAGMLYLLLTGGEIFLRKDFMEIYTEISRMGFHIEIYTNATLITPEIANALGRIPPAKVGVTIYGASPETYERVCGNRKGYRLAKRGVDLLLAEGITVWLKTTIVKGNVDDFDKIAQYAENLGVEFGIVSYISPRREGKCTNPEGERLSPSELLCFREYSNNYFTTRHAQMNYDSKTCFDEDRTAIDGEELCSKSVDAFDCTAGKCSFWITWDGRMTPCPLMDKPQTLPLEDGFTNAWKDIQKGCSLIPMSVDCKECSNKDECIPCPARLKMETGYYDKPAPYLCELIKEMNARKGVNI